LARYAASPVFGIEQYARGLLTYAKSKTAESPKDVKIMFCKKTLQAALSDDAEMLGDVMEYLVKSGHAVKVPGHPECWYID
jgi:hypothetical protein